MVTLRFKLSELGTVTLSIVQPTDFKKVLEMVSAMSGTTLGAVMAVRNGKVLNLQELVYTDDVIDVFPAISGG